MDRKSDEELSIQDYSNSELSTDWTKNTSEKQYN